MINEVPDDRDEERMSQRSDLRRHVVSTTKRISHILHKIKIVEGDITDAFNVNKIIEDYEPDEIYNLAAQSHVGTSFSQPSLTWDVTAAGVLNILEAIRRLIFL